MSALEVLDPRTIPSISTNVTAVGMGCWPITGITSVDVETQQSERTILEAWESGINFYDTAYCYGFEGESERMIGRVLGRSREQLVIATKGGIHWVNGKQVRDGSSETLTRESEESLKRLGMDYVDLLYLHAPDRVHPIEESAEALRRLWEQGKTRAVGISNATVEEMSRFIEVCPLHACQPHYNMLQREIEESLLPWCQQKGVSVIVYWPLMKGLLAGKLARDHQFQAKDGRQKYPMFHGEEWEKNQNFIEDLRLIAESLGKTVPQVVLNWTIHQPGITVALAGAKRPEQIRENAGALGWRLQPNELARIDEALARRGPTVSRGAV